MIISLSIFLTFFSYVQIVNNKIDKKNNKITPFIFLIVLFSLWEFLVLFLYGLNISYDILNSLYLIIYVLSILFFLLFLSRNIYKYKNIVNMKKYFLNDFLYFILMFFLAIILLFYHKNLDPIRSDQFYYEYLMGTFKRIGVYSIPMNNMGSQLLYSDVGLFQFGASFSYKNYMMLMPYFTTFLFFYVLFTSLYVIFSKYVLKSWKQNLFFLIFFIFVVFFYVFFNFQDYYQILVGNYETSYLILLLLIPSFLNMNQIKHFEVFLILFSCIFFNETGILLAWLFILLYIFIFTFRRNRENFSLNLFLSFIGLLVISFYLLLVQFLFTKVSYNDLYPLMKIIPLVFIVSFVWSLVFLFLNYSNTIIAFKINNLAFLSKINKIWNLTFWNGYWFNKKNELILNILNFIFIFVGIIFVYYSLSMYSHTNWIYIEIFFLVIFSLLFLKIYLNRRNINSFFYYFILLNIVSFSIASILQNSFLYIDSSIIQRFYYVALTDRWGIVSASKNFVLIFIFYYFAFHNSKLFNMKKSKKILRAYKSNFLIISSLYTASTLSVIIDISYQPLNIFSYLSFQSIQNNFFGGLSDKTINSLLKIDFANDLIFSDIPISTLNTTGNIAINHRFYNEYWDWKSWPTFKYEDFTFSIDNEEDLINFCLPYMNYVIIKNSNSSLIKIIESLPYYNETHDLDNQILIFKNINVDLAKQLQFLSWNKNTIGF